MEEEFYAVIKLVSGEEIVSKVCPCEEENRTLLILDNPITIEKIILKKFNIPVMKISPWIKYSEEDLFIIDMEKVITITEIKDSNIIESHKKYTKDKNKVTNESQVTPNMGFISSVSDARRSLEKIFNL